MHYEDVAHAHMVRLVVPAATKCFSGLHRKVLNAWKSDAHGKFLPYSSFFLKVNIKITITNFCISMGSHTPV